MKLDSRKFSQVTYKALESLKKELKEDYYKRASGLIQGLPAYISTWGLHRLSGDMKKFEIGKGDDTKYKGKVYRKFLQELKDFSPVKFDVEKESDLINMELQKYTALNHLAIQLAKEWSFWAGAVLGEAE
ncbi:hypothetical protein VB735_11275 [Halotia wernerae UHCC 0503]|nr:hypothetical protein [Halotia wernerae UHCC 0503]